MALIICTHCGKEHSDRIDHCPHCHYNEKKRRPTPRPAALAPEDAEVLKSIRRFQLEGFYKEHNERLWRRVDRDNQFLAQDVQDAEGVQSAATLYDIYMFDLDRLVSKANWTKYHLDSMGQTVDYVRRNYRKIVAKKLFLDQQLPTDYDPARSLSENVEAAMRQVLDIIAEEKDNPFMTEQAARENHDDMALIVQHKFFDNWDDRRIGESLAKKVTGERCRQRYRMFLDGLKEGDRFFNIGIRKELLNEIAKYAEAHCFKKMDDYGMNKNVLRDFMNLSTVMVGGRLFCVPLGEKGVYQRLAEQFTKHIDAVVTPKPRQQIMDEFKADEANAKLLLLEGSDKLLANLFDAGDMEQVEDGLYQSVYSVLRTNEDRICRAMYLIWNERNAAFSMEDIRQKVAELNNRYGLPEQKVSVVPRKAQEQYGFVAVGKFWQRGDKSMTLSEFVKQYVEEKVEFRFSDLKKAVEEKGYSNTEKTIRTYAGKYCVTDSRDRDHFCLEGKAAERESKGVWSVRQYYGDSNAVLQGLKELLEKRGEVKVEEAPRLLDPELPLDENRIERGIRFVIRRYTGKADSPFRLSEGTLQKNGENFDRFDFANAGLRGNYTLMEEVRKIVDEEMKDRNGERMLLSDMQKHVENELGKEVSRNFLIRSLDNPIMNIRKRPGVPRLEIRKIGDNLYVQPEKEDSRVPFFGSVVDDGQMYEQEPRYVRPSRQYWKTCEGLRSELAEREELLAEAGVELGYGIRMLLFFLKESKDKRLKLISDSLYDYFFKASNYLARDRFLNTLRDGYGLVLQKICAERGDSLTPDQIEAELNTNKALEPVMSQVKEFFQVYGIDANDANNVWRRRLPAVTISILQQCRYIANYMALYVYVVAKYGVKRELPPLHGWMEE